MDAAAALVQITTNPDYFLQWYSIQINGSTANSAVMQYYIATRDGAAVQRMQRPGRTLGTLRMHNIRNFSMSSQQNQLDPGDRTQFSAHSIQMVNAGAVNLAALNGYNVLDNSGTNLIVTGQLTGCSFVALRVATGVLMTHIRPIGTTPTQLEIDLRNNGAFAGNAGAITVYGANTNYNHNTQDVSIIGVPRSPTQWRIFCQVHPVARVGNNRRVTRLDYFDI